MSEVYWRDMSKVYWRDMSEVYWRDMSKVYSLFKCSSNEGVNDQRFSK